MQDVAWAVAIVAILYATLVIIFAVWGPKGKINALKAPFKSSILLAAVLAFEAVSGGLWVWAVCRIDKQHVSAAALAAITSTVLWLFVVSCSWKHYEQVVAGYTGGSGILYIVVLAVAAQQPNVRQDAVFLVALHTCHRVLIDGAWAVHLLRNKVPSAIIYG